MAKDSRLINGSVRIDNQVFTAGMEDELAEKASSAQIARLIDKGVITGFGKAKSEPVETPEPPKGKGK